MKLRHVVLVTVIALLAAGCGNDEESDESAKGESTEVVEVSPLTGLEYGESSPAKAVYVVKIENTPAGAPQYGVNQADLVVEQMVEGGVTRLAALYHSTLPTSVGHVRSLRGTDAGIAAPVGGHVVASGGAGPAYEVIGAAGLLSYTEDNNAPGFSSDPAKSRPYNRMLDLAALADTTSGGKIPGPYFEFLPAGAEVELPEAARPVTTASVHFSNSHTTNFAVSDGVWRRTNGLAAEGEEFAATNLVVIYAPEVDAGYRDPAGSPVPETQFQGSGAGVVVIAGHAIDVTWTKDSLAGTVRFTDEAGDAVSLPAGKTWVELVSQERGSATFG